MPASLFLVVRVSAAMRVAASATAVMGIAASALWGEGMRLGLLEVMRLLRWTLVRLRSGTRFGYGPGLILRRRAHLLLRLRRWSRLRCGPRLDGLRSGVRGRGAGLVFGTTL